MVSVETAPRKSCPGLLVLVRLGLTMRCASPAGHCATPIVGVMGVRIIFSRIAIWEA
jgi:hypothetical protein